MRGAIEQWRDAAEFEARVTEKMAGGEKTERTMDQSLEIRDYTPPAGRKYLFTDDLVRITGIPKTTWQKWRSLKKGPAYLKLGRRPAYLPEAVVEWEAKQAVQTA